jgi:hypothetical protein
MQVSVPTTGTIARLRSGKLPFAKRCVTYVLLCGLTLGGCVHIPPDGSIRARNDREIQSLVDLPTPEHLATASMLAMSFYGQAQTDRPTKLIEQAEALAPLRPELVWLQLAQCRRLVCDARARIEDRLKELDPQNGFLWIADLERAQASGSQAAATSAIMRIGRSSTMTFYWNELEVMLVDGLGAAEPSKSLENRGVEAIGFLAAMAIPPLQPMSKACQPDQFDVPGRRAACELMFLRMEQSSTVLTQAFALSVQQRWWPAGSAQREAIEKKRRRLNYLLTTSNRFRWWHANKDMAVRLDAARRSGSEEDVELALVRSFGLPTEPPADWK